MVSRTHEENIDRSFTFFSVPTERKKKEKQSTFPEGLHVSGSGESHQGDPDGKRIWVSTLLLQASDLLKMGRQNLRNLAPV